MNELESSNIRNLIQKYRKIRNVESKERDCPRFKNELNQYFDTDKLARAKNNISCFVESIFKRDENLNYNVESSADIINDISDEIYFSFSSSTASCNVPRLSIESQIKYPQLKEFLENMCRNIHQKTTASDIIDEIEDGFEKLKL